MYAFLSYEVLSYAYTFFKLSLLLYKTDLPIGCIFNIYNDTQHFIFTLFLLRYTVPLDVVKSKG